ncbi:hypothetical protein L2E82_48814 [Cichorium intybus]|uniref:Uncharacterized protein n=1 Tax=Cichorium intybus TaxID=13427 RepID=A0ACB8YYP5_CICIN|nr:hypothetical protein L2E82_48814 [Cichorium intybus]
MPRIRAVMLILQYEDPEENGYRIPKTLQIWYRDTVNIEAFARRKKRNDLIGGRTSGGYVFCKFRRVANLYFLTLSCLSFTPVSPVSLITNMIPLSLMLFVSLVKEAFEDWYVHYALDSTPDVPHMMMGVRGPSKPTVLWLVALYVYQACVEFNRGKYSSLLEMYKVIVRIC